MPTKTETLLSSLKINKLTRSQFLTAKAADEVDLDNEFYMTGEVLGEGDMLKEVYDKNGNGIVDNAEKVNGLTVLTAVPANAKFTDTTYSTFKGATSSSTGGAGLVPAPSSGQQTLFLRGDGIWASVPSGGVTGVKGNTETTYRTGQVNLTADNIGALPISGEATIQDDLIINILNNYLMLKNGEIILDSCAIESSSIYVSNSSINFNNTILTIDTASGFNYDGGFY